MEQSTSIHEVLEPVLADLNASGDNASRLEPACRQLVAFSNSVRDASLHELADFSRLLVRLVRIYKPRAGEGIADDHQAIHAFVKDSLWGLSQAINQEDHSADQIAYRSCEAHERWGDCLELLGEPTSDQHHWHTELEQLDDADDSAEGLPARNHIGIILDSLASTATAVEPVHETIPETSVPLAKVDGDLESESSTILDDPELREAYVDDAQRCLASIESSLMAYEEQPTNAQPLQQVCRELHTLKGASASVGLENLARFLHQVEDDLQLACDSNREEVDLQPIFKAVDEVRKRTHGQSTQEISTAASAKNLPSTDKPAEHFVETSPISQDSVRVKAAQLDRLMDMLAELVMLRNRRESRVQRLKDDHSELVRCVSRLRAYEENYSTAVVTQSPKENRDGSTRIPRRTQHVSSLTEIANDLLELGSGLRDLYEPVGEENMAISGFIRQFRQELIQLRRVPMRGLFQRLRRSARDAARTEGKRVRLQLLGEDVGLESSIQQQLYEPLLHIVRNAVSHGIESEQQRQASGKSAEGTVTLEAHGGANLLVITVRDDGQGLDYEALRRRGLELGLIPSDRPTSKPDLARLIFYPGFSTKSDTSAVSGRGVGMDVVANALERMHSWTEVDSVPGQGTSIRLLIPMHSVIEHVMVFRVGGQEFGVPTQFVKFAGAIGTVENVDYPVTNVGRLFGLKSMSSSDQQLLVLSHAAKEATVEHCDDSRPVTGQKTEKRLGILVDEIVGPEEVVVRPLPNLLAAQGLFSGVTLSGLGDIMLLFDSQQLLERGLCTGDTVSQNLVNNEAPRRTKRVLVVDDSRTSRRTLIHCLNEFPFEIDESVDGVDALRRIKDQSYDLIFTDLEMPELGGMELLREVREHSASDVAKTPVVIVSSRGEDQFRQEANRLAVNDYLIKPVTESIVRQSLDRLATTGKEETA